MPKMFDHISDPDERRRAEHNHEKMLNRRSYYKRKRERLIDALVSEELELEAMCEEPYSE
jgi:hypothetical protein